EGEEPLEARFVPMLCQQCENAPCEPVCPVFAAYHTVDGLNGQVYNRCVGTRYCGNNCPYKVRRFNWLRYPQPAGDRAALYANPDVTVRGRGVMEKCTFCVQRLRRAERRARLDGVALVDGAVQTACQQACAMGAITFGLVSDPHSEVLRRRAGGRAHAVLHALGTEPRVRYLARVTHPNAALGDA
ncbi:MAG TPA: 4Fe-4S dicluster domain-containing protein, partial [Myxococcota bacterium]|nr:4Fe-4S dicluster domain-containing protein [Myxococcota bacterium]